MPPISAMEKEVFSNSDADEHSSDAESIADTESSDNESSDDDYTSDDDSFIAKDEEDEDSDATDEKSASPVVFKKPKTLKSQLITKTFEKKVQSKKPNKTSSEKATPSKSKKEDEVEAKKTQQQTETSAKDTSEKPKLFVEFSTDAAKSCQEFKKGFTSNDFALVKQGTTITSKKATAFLERNKDYSIVKVKDSNRFFRAIHVKNSDIDAYAVIVSPTHDNSAVQVCMGKQTAVRKTVPMCEFSITPGLCPSNLLKYYNKLDLSTGNMFFSTDNAKAYLAKIGCQENKKRKADQDEAKPADSSPVKDKESPPAEPKKRRIEPTSIPSKKPPAPSTERNAYQLYLDVAKIIADPSTEEKLDKAIKFITASVDHIKYSAELKALGVTM